MSRGVSGQGQLCRIFLSCNNVGLYSIQVILDHYGSVVPGWEMRVFGGIVFAIVFVNTLVISA